MRTVGKEIFAKIIVFCCGKRTDIQIPDSPFICSGGLCGQFFFIEEGKVVQRAVEVYQALVSRGKNGEISVFFCLLCGVLGDGRAVSMAALKRIGADGVADLYRNSGNISCMGSCAEF